MSKVKGRRRDKRRRECEGKNQHGRVCVKCRALRRARVAVARHVELNCIASATFQQSTGVWVRAHEGATRGRGEVCIAFRSRQTAHALHIVSGEIAGHDFIFLDANHTASFAAIVRGVITPTVTAAGGAR